MIPDLWRRVAWATFLIASIVAPWPSLPSAAAQTSIRSHYANGQIWVVWQASTPLPETFAIYANDAPITLLSEASLVGRLFEYEYFPGALRDQVGPVDRPWVIPAAGGVMLDTLASDEALFVATPHDSSARYYAVVAWGDTTVVPGINATIDSVQALMAPSERVTCYLQAQVSTQPGTSTKAYVVWADGRLDPQDARPDFPVMANPAKNGMPSLFLVSQLDNLGPGPHPVAYWLHGAEGRAMQSTPGSRRIYGIDPDGGLLVAHNDDLVRWTMNGTALSEEASNSWWFGWGLQFDPFLGQGAPPAGETIINYTQRRLLWIHSWLIQQGMVDPQRASLLGHSLGAAGTTALGKASPNVFGSCTMFNNGFDGPDVSPMPHELYGTPADSLRCNLVNAQGDSLLIFSVFDLNTPISASGDMPFFRVFHGKNDDNGAMSWDSFVVSEYVRADSLGWGVQLYWDERPHSPDETGIAHWAHGFGMNEQTQRDNVDYQEKYRSDHSFPAFYNHRLQPGAADPGDGTRGTGGAGDGDDWGTWGGYHDWEVDTLVDDLGVWEATIYLVARSPWSVDNHPGSGDSLTSDFTLRRAQSFAPAPGDTVSWDQIDLGTGARLRHGTVVADANGRIQLSGVVTYNDPRRTRLRFWQPTITDVARVPIPTPRLRLRATPNPFNPGTTLHFEQSRPGVVLLTVHDVRGRRLATLASRWFPAGSHSLTWNGMDDDGRAFASGNYLALLRSNNVSEVLKVVLIK